MTIECPVLPELKPWYDAFYDALEELAPERGDDAWKATLAEPQDPAPARREPSEPESVL
jgi:hypothetical protein